ncbi:MAG: hypothetical protein V7641_907 [Blastocatellia bacterium]
MVKTYKIFPPIGIARLGNSNSEYYIASESPQMNFVPPGGYRDADLKVKRMGCRFRIYEYEDSTPVREITANEATIEWRTHLVNSKAAKDGLNPLPKEQYIIDSGYQSVRGPNQNKELKGYLRPSGHLPIEVKLGNLLTDEQGRLIVLGGHGKSASWTGSPPTGIQNAGWYDDASDGRIEAALQFHGSGDIIFAEESWVLVGPPRFAQPLESIVSLYDLVWDRSKLFHQNPSRPASFTGVIYPVLFRAVFMQWTNSTARSGHSGSSPGNFLRPDVFPLLHDKNATGGDALRKAVFAKLRNPQGGGGNMPLLSGGLTVTPLQYEQFSKWSQGNYKDNWDPTWDPAQPPQPKFKNFPVAQQPDVLTEAALGAGVGGAFFPGIEAGSKMADPNTYQLPFRVSHLVRSGDLTQSLSVPWQADFKFCSESWWPAARPGMVNYKEGGVLKYAAWDRGVNTAQDMVNLWSQLGFLAKDTTSSQLLYVETERTLTSAMLAAGASFFA